MTVENFVEILIIYYFLNFIKIIENLSFDIEDT